MKKRLVITGMGAITPLGNNVNAYWEGLIGGASGIAGISRFDASALPVRIAAEVRDFDGPAILSKHVARSTAPFLQYALAAAEEAIACAHAGPFLSGSRTGICMGTAMAGMAAMSEAGARYSSSSTGRVSPHLVPGSIANMGSAHLAIRHGITGPGLTLGTACAAGSDALINAALLILAGEIDMAVVMAGESIQSPAIISSLAQARALSRQNDEPAKASRPFDLKRDGFVIGEGGGAVILESEEHALRRDAPVLAELRGWANSLDAWHITAPDPEGNGAAACMARALSRAGMTSDAVDYINAHGTGTHLGDLAETVALKKVFAKTPPVSSTKGATGHLMGAGGLTELIACIKSIQTGMAPPTLNLDTPDPECDLDYIPKGARSLEINTAMSNAFGFGGQNSSLIIARYASREKV